MRVSPYLEHAASPRMMGHFQLGHSAADPRGEDREESVHVTVEAHVLDDLAPVRLERAAEVVERHPADLSDQEVCRVRRQAPREPEIVPAAPPSRDHVVRIAERLEQPRDVTRIVLHVGVQGDEDRVARMSEPRRQRRRLAEVLPQPDQAHVGVPCGQRSQHVPGAVGGSVVHVDDLVVAAEGLERLGEACVERLQVIALVEDRQDDRDALSLSHHAVRSSASQRTT